MKIIKFAAKTAATFLGLLLILAIGLVGPNVVFRLIWLEPTQALPPIEAQPQHAFVLPGVPASQTTANYDLLLKAIQHASLPSMSAAIAYDGKLQWAGAAGYADIQQRQFATTSSRYQLASVSKALTGTLLAILVDKQKIDLDREARAYFPALSEHYAGVTPRMLATHTAGVRHYPLDPTWWLGWHPAFSDKNYATVEEGLTVFIDKELLFPPGTDYEYSTYGYSLLSKLMEGATRSSFPNLLREELFIPAGMYNTAVDKAQAMENRVSSYMSDDGKYTDAYPSNYSDRIAGAGLVSTPSDLAQLGQVLLAGTLLSENSRTLMWTRAKLADGRTHPDSYGLGWHITETRIPLRNGKSTTIIHHGGWQNGGSAFIMIVPAYGISVAVAANSGSDAARDIVREVGFALVSGAVAEMTSPNQGSRQ